MRTKSWVVTSCVFFVAIVGWLAYGVVRAQKVTQGRFGPLYLLVSRDGVVTGALSEQVGDGETATIKQCALMLRGTLSKNGEVRYLLVKSLDSAEAIKAELRFRERRAFLSLPESLPGCNAALDLRDAAARGFLFRESLNCSTLAMVKANSAQLISRGGKSRQLQSGEIFCLSPGVGKTRHVFSLRGPLTEGEVNVEDLMLAPE